MGLVGLADDELEAVECERGADRGHAPRPVNEQPAQRLEVPLRGDLTSEARLEISEGDRRVGHEAPLADLFELLVRVGVVLIVDLADDLLEDVLERHDPAGATELVGHHRHVEALGAHLAENARRALRLDDEEDGRAKEIGELRLLEVAIAEEGEEVLHVEEADDVIERLPVHRVARVTLGGDVIEHLVQGRAHLDGRDQAARHHERAGCEAGADDQPDPEPQLRAIARLDRLIDGAAREVRDRQREALRGEREDDRAYEQRAVRRGETEQAAERAGGWECIAQAV